MSESPASRPVGSLARIAALLAVIMALSRLVGFARTWMLSQSLGTSCLGTAFTTANALPNVVFEIAVGGALAGSVVPLLAGSLSRGDRDHARAVVSALYGWMLLVLVPLTALVALLAAPLSSLLLGGAAGSTCPAAQLQDVTTSLLVIFAVQIPIYGLTVIMQGALQADHRFMPTAWAPLLSSTAMIVVFVTYQQIAGDTAGDLAALSTTELLVLGWGTTAAVGVLLVAQLPATARAQLLMKPRLRFPANTAGRARSLGLAGFVVVAGQWLVYVLLFRLVNDRGVEGSAVVLLLAWTVFLLPWAVLISPVAISVFPRLATAHEQGDAAGFARQTGVLLRATLWLSLLGAAGLVAIAPGLAAFLVVGAPGRQSALELSAALVAFAPAVVGFAVLGVAGRVLYSAHRGAATAAGTLVGWAIAAIAAIGLVRRGSGQDAVWLAGLALSIGLLIGALWLLIVTAQTTGGHSRILRTGVSAAGAALAAAGAARLVSGQLIDSPAELSTGQGLALTLLLGAVATAVFLVVASLLDRPAAKEALSRLQSSRRAEVK